jgi:hypothetical protein
MIISKGPNFITRIDELTQACFYFSKETEAKRFAQGIISVRGIGIAIYFVKTGSKDGGLWRVPVPYSDADEGTDPQFTAQINAALVLGTKQEQTA